MYNLLFKLSKNLLLIAVIFSYADSNVQGQGVIPTKGKDFWMGFPNNPSFSGLYTNTKRCDVFITSDVTTSGLISIPQQSWSQFFTVVANQTTTISLPINQVEHMSSEIVESKGIRIETVDTVSVFAITFVQYSADASVVYPKQTLGTEYRVSSYRGLQGGYPNVHSSFLVVSTEDGTQIEITPSVPTLTGKPAGVPFIVNLNAGESYQVYSSTYSNDLSGTVIKATDSSGSCRPFAVFSGTLCANIPTNCTACDIIYDQALPVSHWGQSYYLVPFSFATSYTYRIMAHQNATTYSVSGGAPAVLNAGQFVEFNNVTGTQCVTSSQPVSVIQYMQGISCSGAGDPSMMYLNSSDQKIDDVTFSTVTSTVINQHNVNIIMNTAHIGQLTLDGSPVAPSLFTALTGCTGISYAQISLTQGSHTLKADSGFTAYVYGTGSAESYAYSVGSFSKKQPIQVDSILCSNDTMNLGTNNLLYNGWWSTLTLPNDTIGTGNYLTLYPPIIPDIYVFHGSEFISGCDREIYYSVQVPDPPQTQITNNSVTICQNQQVQLNATTIPASSNYIYSWTPVTGLNNANIPNPVLTATTSGWYVVAVSSAVPCAPVVYDSVYIDVQQIPLPTVTAGANQTICQGDTAVLSVTGTGSFVWSPGGNTTSSITVSPAATTNYIVYVTDSNGCQNSDTVTLSVSSLPVVNAGSDKSICSGANATLTAVGGISYQWFPGGSMVASITVSPASTTNYIVQATGVNGCVNNDTVQVVVNPLPLASAGPDQSICFGYSTTLTATGGGSFLWNMGAGTASSITVAPLVTTNYIVTVTDSNGCENKDTVNVTVNPSPVISAGPDQSICLGATAILTATGGLNYLWNPGGDTSNTIVVSPGSNTIYTVISMGANGCVGEDSVSVNIIPIQANVISAGPDQWICVGDNAVLTATGGVSYVWNPGGITSTTINVAPNLSTSYIVIGTDTNGCINRDTIIVNVMPLPSASAGTAQAICIGSNTTLNASGGVSYLWNPGAFAGNPFTLSPTSSSYFSVEVTDSAGCKNIDSVFVTVNQLPIADAGPDHTICYNDSVTIVSASTGVSYLWNPTGITAPGIVVSPPGTTTYILQVTDNNGCINYDTVEVFVNPLPIAEAGPDQSICYGYSTVLTATGGNNYLWSPGNLNSASITVTPAVSTTYTVLVSDINGCMKSDSVFVNLDPQPLAAVAVSSPVCERENIDFGNTTFISSGSIVTSTWSFGDGGSSNSFNTSHSYFNAGVYPVQLAVESDAGCMDTINFNLTVNAEPIVDFITGNICTRQPLQFQDLSTAPPMAIAQWIWDFGDGNSHSEQHPIHIYSTPGFYDITLTATSDSGCAAILTKTQAVEVYPLPTASFTFSPPEVSILEPIVHFTDHSSNAIHWLWLFGDEYGTSEAINPMYIFRDTGVFIISQIVTNSYGCKDTAAGKIYVEPFFTVYIPNAFTPNSDGINDSYGVNGVGIGDFELMIFDRWGNKIFQTNDMSYHWNGKINGNGNDSPQGVYTYVLNLTNYKNEKLVYKGHLSLIR